MPAGSFTLDQFPIDIADTGGQVRAANLSALAEWWLVNQGRDEAQQDPLHWTIPGVQKSTQLDMRQPATRGRVWLVDDEGPAVLRFPAQVPGIPTRASIKLSSLGHRAILPCLVHLDELKRNGLGKWSIRLA